MRVLRCTHFSQPKEPQIVVVRDCDVKDTLESVAIGAVAKMDTSLVLYDIFEMDDADLPAATLEAGRRTREVADHELHQAFLYHWYVSQFSILNDGGTLSSDEAAPLTPEQIRVVLAQLKEHPGYRNFTLMIPASDGSLVTLDHGVLK